MVGSPSILLVGHCSPDAWAMRSALGSLIPGADVETANDQKTLERLLPQARLLLVNRVLDGRFDAEDGLEMIAQLKGRAALMLVSNLPDAQAAAIAAGALPGFGKRDLYADETRKRLAAALA